MSGTNTQAETTTERKPPTIADIVREKTGDGALIIDFFTDVMTGRIEGAELCHRIDAAKQLVKYGSKDAAEFLAKYKGVPCGHSINGRPNQADPCIAEERSLVAVTLNAPPTLTRDFLTVLSGIDEFLMVRLIRAQTADAGTIIEFLDDVMQDRTEGFKTHHRIAAAKELIVHIVRDEQPSHTPSPSTRETDKRGDSTAVGADPCVRPLPGSQTPSPSTGEGWGEGDTSVVPAEAGTQGSGGGRSTAANPTRTEPALSTAEGSAHPNPSSSVVPEKSLPRTRYGAGTQRGGGGRSTPANPARTEPNSSVVPAKAGTQRGGARSPAANPPRTEPALSTAEGSAHPNPSSSVVPANTIVVPAKAGTHGGGGGRSTAANSAHPEPAEGPQDHKVRRPRTRRTRTQRRRDGNARAAILGKGSERNSEQRHEKPAPVELTIAERRIKERLEQHWHEPDPYGAPIDSTHPGRSPPW